MKTIIAGSRHITDESLIQKAVDASGFEVSVVVHGAARGVDTLAWDWALNKNLPVMSFPADWYGKGRGAGPIRNTEMANYADALIAIWDGKSRGTKDMIDKATKKGLKVFIYKV